MTHDHPDPTLPQSRRATDNPPPSAWSGTGHRRDRTLTARQAFGLLLLWIVISSLGFAQQHLDLPAQFGFLGAPALPQALATAMLVAGILLFRWRDTAFGIPKPGTASILWFPALYLVAFAGTITLLGPPPADVMIGLFYVTFWIALSEELLFRGLLFPALRRHMRLWPAIGTTCAVFGAIHLMNALEDGDLTGATVQTIAATMTGFLLLALRLRCASLWPAILYHMAWNLGVFGIGFAARGDGDVDVTGSVIDYNPTAVALLLLLMLPNAVYAFWLLRHTRTGALPGDVAQSDDQPIAP